MPSPIIPIILFKFLLSVTMRSTFCLIADKWVYVTEFAKRGLIHASNYSTLRMCNSTSIGRTALIFGSKSFLSLF